MLWQSHTNNLLRNMLRHAQFGLFKRQTNQNQIYLHSVVYTYSYYFLCHALHINMAHLEGALCRHHVCDTCTRYFIYVYCCSTRLLCQMVLGSFISNMAVSRVEHDMYAYLTGTPELFNEFVLLSVFCIVIRRSLFFLLAIILSVVLRITASDYPFVIFTFFLPDAYQCN